MSCVRSGNINYVKPTARDVDSERTSGNLLSSKRHINDMRPLQNGDISAPENTVASVLQDNLYCVSPASRVHNDDANITSPRPWRTNQGQEDKKHWRWLSLKATERRRRSIQSFFPPEEKLGTIHEGLMRSNINNIRSSRDRIQQIFCVPVCEMLNHCEHGHDHSRN